MRKGKDEDMGSIEAVAQMHLRNINRIVMGLKELKDRYIDVKLRCGICGGEVVVRGFKDLDRVMECKSCGMRWYRG